MEPDAFPDNEQGYGTQIMFDEEGQPAAAYFKDDYEAWYNYDLGIMGSNLDDANLTDVEMPVTFEEWLKEYLDNMFESYAIVRTNNVEACQRYIDSLGLAFDGWTAEEAWRSDDRYIWTIERIKNVGMNHYTDWLNRQTP